MVIFFNNQIDIFWLYLKIWYASPKLMIIQWINRATLFSDPIRQCSNIAAPQKPHGVGFPKFLSDGFNQKMSQILHPDSPSSVFRLKLPHRDLSRSKCLSSPVGSEVWLVYHGLPSCTMNRKMHQCPRLFNCRGSILTNFPGSTSVQKSNSCSPKAAPRHIQVVVHNVPGKNVKKL